MKLSSWRMMVDLQHLYQSVKNIYHLDYVRHHDQKIPTATATKGKKLSTKQQLHLNKNNSNNKLLSVIIMIKQHIVFSILLFYPVNTSFNNKLITFFISAFYTLFNCPLQHHHFGGY